MINKKQSKHVEKEEDNVRITIKTRKDILLKKKLVIFHKTMKKTLVFLITLILIVSINPVFASTKTVSAGIGPNSFFYFFDIAFEEINLFFTFDAKKKVKTSLEYADERIAELTEISKEKTPQVYMETVGRYKKQISYAKEISIEIEQGENKKNILDLITEKEKDNSDIVPFVVVDENLKIPKIVDIKVEEIENEDIKPTLKTEENKLIKQKVVQQVSKPVAVKVKPTNNTNDEELERLRAEEKLKAEQEEKERQEQQRQNYDQVLSKLIAQRKQNISIFKYTLEETEEFTSVIQATMNKYADEFTIQQSGKELLKENANLASISKKLISIETSRASELSSYLGLGILPEIDGFTYGPEQYNDYHQQYQKSDEKIISLISDFVSTEKVVLERLTQKAKQKLENAKNASLAQASDPQIESALSILQKTLNNEENRQVPMAVIVGRKEKAVQDWIKQNPNIFSYPDYIKRFNAILTSYGLYTMRI